MHSQEFKLNANCYVIKFVNKEYQMLSLLNIVAARTKVCLRDVYGQGCCVENNREMRLIRILYY